MRRQRSALNVETGRDCHNMSAIATKQRIKGIWRRGLDTSLEQVPYWSVNDRVITYRDELFLEFASRPSVPSA